jgi:beta-ureidopropionase
MFGVCSYDLPMRVVEQRKYTNAILSERTATRWGTVEMRLLVAAVQMHPQFANVLSNLQKMRRLALQASDALGRVDLLVYPELALTGLGPVSTDLAVPADGDHAETMAEVAKEIGGYVVYGFLERSSGGVYNSAMVAGPCGPVGVYRKVHLWGDETGYAHSGSAYPVFQLPWGTLGCLICYDLNFPEAARVLALQGASIIALPAAWDWPYLDGWELCLRARAYDNLTYLVAAGQWGTYLGGKLLGHSRVVGPDGRFLAMMGDFGDGWCAAEIDPEERRVLEERGHRFLQDRRPETYGPLVADGLGARGLG